MPKLSPLERVRQVDQAVNAAKVAELHRHGVTVYWLAVSPVECQALCHDVVSAAIKEQARICLTPGVGER